MDVHEPLEPVHRCVLPECLLDTIHHLAEVLKIAFADRAAASGDPDFVSVPVERLTSKEYANERRGAIDPRRAQKWGAGVAQLEGAQFGTWKIGVSAVKTNVAWVTSRGVE
jgi:gamma-glutamyltranspeptidase